jgi:hypothetical protein
VVHQRSPNITGQILAKFGTLWNPGTDPIAPQSVWIGFPADNTESLVILRNNVASLPPTVIFTIFDNGIYLISANLTLQMPNTKVTTIYEVGIFINGLLQTDNIVSIDCNGSDKNSIRSCSFNNIAFLSKGNTVQFVIAGSQDDPNVLLVTANTYIYSIILPP